MQDQEREKGRVGRSYRKSAGEWVREKSGNYQDRQLGKGPWGVEGGGEGRLLLDVLSKCLYVRLQQTQFCWALWNRGQAWVPRSDFVDSTRGHEVPDAGENQILGASDMNRVGVFEPYSSGNSSVTYIINCHACVPGTCMVSDGNLHFFLSLIPRVRPGGTPCVMCHLSPYL